MIEWLVIAWLYVTGIVVMYGLKVSNPSLNCWKWWELVFYPVYVIPVVLVGMGQGLSKQLLNGNPLLNYALGLMVMFYVVSWILNWLAMAGVGYLLVWQFILVMLPVFALSWLIYQFEGKEWQ